MKRNKPLQTHNRGKLFKFHVNFNIKARSRKLFAKIRQKFTRKKIEKVTITDKSHDFAFLAVFCFSVTANAFVYFNVQYLYLRAIFSLAYLMFVPGYLILKLFKHVRFSFWEALVYIAGLSLFFIMTGGLLLNWVLPLINITGPLSITPLLLFFNLLVLILYVVALIKNRYLKIPKIADIHPHAHKINLALIIRNTVKKVRVAYVFQIMILAALPILSTLGAISINNGGTTVFTLIMLGAIGLLTVYLVIFTNKINENMYPISLYFMALSLLLMTSLRGWYTTGHDNQQEFYVFELTKSVYHWDISAFRDTYNACLSLNILPTIFSSFTNIPDVYIYKIIYQILFPLAVIPIFLVIKRYTENYIAFLTSFIYVTFPTFMHDMPMLNRQEIALIFFSLCILLLFDKKINSGAKTLLFVIFGTGIIISHYSTSYIATAIFLISYVTLFIVRRLPIIKRLVPKDYKNNLKLMMILPLIVITFVWNSQLTKTTRGFSHLITNTWENIDKAFTLDMKSGDVFYSIFNWTRLDKDELLKLYVEDETAFVEHYKDPRINYDKTIYNKYPINLVEDEKTPVTKLGTFLAKYVDVFSLNYAFKQSSAKLIQVLLLMGFIAIVFNKSPYIKNLDFEYTIMAFVSIMLLAVFIVLPLFSTEYGTLRFFQQTLIFLGLPALIGGSLIFGFLGDIKMMIPTTLSAAFFITFYLFVSGFIPQLTGNFYALLNLNNSGIYYETYYVQKPEVDAMHWLETYKAQNPIVLTGGEATSKLLTFDGFNTTKKILPATIRKDAYVFLSYINTTKTKTTVYYKGSSLNYIYPIEFLDDNKNLVYNNGGVKVYR